MSRYVPRGLADWTAAAASLTAPAAQMPSAGIVGGSQVARYGPFVMNTQEQIRQAILDFQSGRFGKEIDGYDERARKTEQAKRTQRETGRWQRDNDEL